LPDHNANRSEQSAFSSADTSATTDTEVPLNPEYFSSVFSHFEEARHFEGDDTALGRLRSYCLDLAPQLLLSRGAMVDLLISSDVGRYLEYKALERIYVAEGQGYEKVPLSKEDVFLSSNVSVVDKRRLMKFLTFCLDHENQPQEYNGEIVNFSQLFSTKQTKKTKQKKKPTDFRGLPFSQFLEHKQITGYLQSVIRFAVALDQHGMWPRRRA